MPQVRLGGHAPPTVQPLSFPTNTDMALYDVTEANRLPW
jgi:hypothetical protein